jgi:hypothetical protein
MSGRRDPSELILGRLFSGPANYDPEGARIVAAAMDILLSGHPPVGSDTPQILGAGIATKAGLRTPHNV